MLIRLAEFEDVSAILDISNWAAEVTVWGTGNSSCGMTIGCRNGCAQSAK
ncbi:MAG: hypothetical protein IID30_06245 [Planctomycetes bacterium]|nr:hypothetical protein [Planctomycetota bacterium]